MRTLSFYIRSTALLALSCILLAAGCKGHPDPFATPVLSLHSAYGEHVVEEGEHAMVLPVGASLEHTIHAFDPDDAKRITLSASVVGGSLSAEEAGFTTDLPVTVEGDEAQTIELAGTAAEPGTIELEMVASMANHSETMLLAIRINAPPVLAAPTAPGSVVEVDEGRYLTELAPGTPLTTTIEASDPDPEDTLTLSVTVTGGSLSAEDAGFTTALPASTQGNSPVTLELDGTAAIPGTIELEAFVEDGLESDSFVLEIEIVEAPQILAPSGPGTVTGGPASYSATVPVFESLNFTVEAIANNDVVTFTSQVTGGSLTAEQAGFTTPVDDSVTSYDQATLAFAGTAGPQAGSVQVTLEASVPQGPAAMAILTIQIVAESPTFTSTPPEAATPNFHWSYTPEVTGTPPPEIQVGALPSWISWDGTTLSGIPVRNDLPSPTITLVASNGVSPEAVQTFELERNPEMHLSVVDGAWNFAWARSEHDVHFAGDDGMVAVTGGIEIAPNPAPTNRRFRSIWGPEQGDELVAVGSLGSAFHYDGDTWTQQQTPGSATLEGVWGSSPSNVFAVGNSGTILHYDGSGWSSMNSPTSSVLRGVWGAGPNDVIAVGHTGAYRYDGTQWSSMPSSSTQLYAVSGTSATNIYAVGSQGTILHFDGSIWSPVASPTNQTLYGISVAPNGEVFAVGRSGVVCHFDGASWSEEYPFGSSLSDQLRGVVAVSASNVYVVGVDGRIGHFTGSWSELITQAPQMNRLESIHGLHPQHVLAAGRSGQIFRYDGVDWQPMNTPSSHSLNAIHAYSLSEAIAAGDHTAFHYDGVAWTSDFDADRIDALWGEPGGDTFGVGRFGDISRFDGSQWHVMNSGTSSHLHDVWGSSSSNVFAVGTNGTILHYDGTSWSSMASGTTEILNGVWGRGPNDVFAVGANGTIRHYDGTSWSTMNAGTTMHFDSIRDGYGFGMVAVSRLGGMLRYDGSQWHEVEVSGSYDHLWVDPSTEEIWLLNSFTSRNFIVRMRP